MRGTTPAPTDEVEDKKVEDNGTCEELAHPLATYIPLDQKLMKNVKNTDEADQ